MFLLSLCFCIDFLCQMEVVIIKELLKGVLKNQFFVRQIVKMHYSQYFFGKKSFLGSDIRFCSHKYIKTVLCVFLICFFYIKFIFNTNFLKY